MAAGREALRGQNEMATDVFMFVIQYFPIDMLSLQSLLAVSESFNRKTKNNELLWVAMAKRASKGCQACFLESRECTQYSSSSRACYWRNVVQVFTAISSLRRQWRVKASVRTFINTGGSRHIMRPVQSPEAASFRAPAPPSMKRLRRALASSFRSWLSPRSTSPSSSSDHHSHHSSRSPSRFSSSCTSVEDESERKLREDEEKDTKEEKIGDISSWSSRGSNNSVSEKNIDRMENIDVGDRRRRILQRSTHWEYCGQSVTVILDMFLQQEALALLCPPSCCSPHAHCLEFYPAAWQNSLQQHSAHTCFPAFALDTSVGPSRPSALGASTAAVARVMCACRCSSWQELDAAPWLSSLCSSLFTYTSSIDKNGKSKKFPFPRWLLQQLWRAAGGQAEESSSVRFFATRIAKKYIFRDDMQRGLSIAAGNVRREVPVRRVRASDHPGAPLLLVALCFSQRGLLVRVAGLCSNNSLLDHSFAQMFPRQCRAFL